MRKFSIPSGGINYLTKHIGLLPARAARMPVEVASRVAPLLSNNIKLVYGNTTLLADLADSTQAEREREGYTPNDPLLRSGDLREHESFGYEGDGMGQAFAAAGNSDPKSTWLEHGNASRNLPPRPVHLIGLEATIPFAKTLSVAASRKLLE